MQKSMFSFAFFLLACVPHMLIAQSSSRINPTPQVIQTDTTAVAIKIPDSYRIIMDASLKDSYAYNELKRIIPQQNGENKAFTITAGIRGNKAINKYKKKIPLKPEGYYLSIQKNQITLAGTDERGLFYAVQTLAQLMDNRTVYPTEITDYPDVPYRGVVEGFYGTPWSHAARIRQLEFYGRNKMNTYLYGPKDDPYHSVPNWRKPYPEKEAAQLKELVDVAHKNGVIFYWAIHPGGDIKWNDTDRDLLLAKFENMYQLGVRAFAVFFDDISGEGTKADRQANLLNYIDDHFVKVKKDVAPLIMCPTEYNKSWSNVKGGYLTTLGSKLNPGIQIMWTGDRVIACIDKQSMDFINPLIKRKAFIWWNFPVSDYVRDHMLLGPVYGNDTTIKEDLSGFVSNPMEHAEASKISLFSVADYSWNMHKYDSDASWKRAIDDLLPSASCYLKTFASHSSALGPNGHGFNRDESVELQPTIKAFVEKYKAGEFDSRLSAIIQKECNELSTAADVLIANTENRPLINELDPWLRQAKLVGEYGQSILTMTLAAKDNDKQLFNKSYTHSKALLSQMYTLDATYNQNPYQPGVKIGSEVLLPAFNTLFAQATEQFNKRNNVALDTRAVYQPFTLSSNIPQLTTQPIRNKGNQVNVSPSNEVIKWPANADITITMDYARKLESLTFDLGTTPNITQSFICEVALENNEWQVVSLQQQGKTMLKATSLPQQKVLKIRLKNKSDKEVQVYFKQFRFTTAN